MNKNKKRIITALEQYKDACLEGEDDASKMEAKETEIQLRDIEAHGIEFSIA